MTAASTPAIPRHPAKAALFLGAWGVVFGDIGLIPAPRVDVGIRIEL